MRRRMFARALRHASRLSTSPSILASRSAHAVGIAQKAVGVCPAIDATTHWGTGISSLQHGVIAATVGLLPWGVAVQRAADALRAQLPLLILPALVFMVGKTKRSGKNKRIPKPANHGSKPCSHVGRRMRRPRRNRVKHDK